MHIGPSAKAANEIQRAYLGPHLAGHGRGHRRDRPHRVSRDGLRAMLEHLRAQGVPFKQRRANGQALFQLFFHDPNGVKIELNYAAEEAQGIEAELMASDLLNGVHGKAPALSSDGHRRRAAAGSAGIGWPSRIAPVLDPSRRKRRT